MSVDPLTIVGQMITFALFVWFVMKFVWPPLMNAIEDRQKTIADGLAGADKAKEALKSAEAEREAILAEAREKAAEIIANANRRGSDIVDAKTAEAAERAEKETATAQAKLEQEVSQTREALRKEVAGLAATGAGRILDKEIDAGAHSKILDDLAAEL